MSPYGWAWVVVAVSLMLGLFAFLRATRGPRLRRTRTWLAALLAVWLLLPAAVPGYPGHYAPAFLVFAFEWLFQAPGEPRAAGVILVGGAALLCALGLLVGVWRRRGSKPDA
jgi:hypothetical protein